MSTQILLIGVLVDMVNFLFRYLPLRLGSPAAPPDRLSTAKWAPCSTALASLLSAHC